AIRDFHVTGVQTCALPISVFGELTPDYSELLRPYLFENGKRIAYETGTTLYNRLGLTTQMAFRTKIASRSKRINIDRGALKADEIGRASCRERGARPTEAQ